MMRLIGVIAVLAIAATLAHAHGSRYRGPSGEVPPNMRKPSDPPPPEVNPAPTPPPEDGGPTPTPPPDSGGARPTSPIPESGDSGQPRAVPEASGGSGSGPGATPTGRRPVARAACAFDTWRFWWSYNDDEILDLRARLRALGLETETVDTTAGVGGRHGRAVSARQAPTELAVRERILPALFGALDPALHFDIRSSAVIALGKIGATQTAASDRIAARLMEILENRSGSEHFTVEESAALALGLLGKRDAAILTTLQEKLLDRRGSRTRTRAFAALALGLLRVPPTDPAHPKVLEALRSAVRSADETQDDVPACALLAMGLSGDPVFVPELVPMVQTGSAYGTRKLNDLLRSYAASSLGKIAETDATPASEVVVETLRRAILRRGTHTRRSAVIALGSIGMRAELESCLRGEIVSVLSYLTRHGEAQTANFAAISLGRIGGASEDLALRGRIHEALDRQMRKGATAQRTFGALGIGLLGRNRAGTDSFVDGVAREFRNHRGNPADRGAYAIALGMLGERRVAPDLVAIVRDKTMMKGFRGHCAVALGMLRHAEALPAIRKVMVEELDPDLRVHTTIAAGLLGGSRVSEDLVEILRDPRSSLYVQGSVALSLGQIGDRRAIDPLLEILEDESAPDLKRALATAALGLLGDRRDLTVLSRLSKDVNYRAQVDAIAEVLTIL